MPRAATRSKNQDKQEPVPTEAPAASIPLEAVPHLYNQRVLQWHQAQFNALKAIHEKLEEILEALKEN